MSARSWFSEQLLSWYEEEHRDLPWRRTKDPYRIWLSEVMLQQTRVEQGVGYYERFLDAFPTVHALAAASERKVLRLWQGLGYYSRARNLHAAARQVVLEHGGRFPADHTALRALPGVGDYTAAAVASIAFGLHHAVVDGNVYRVLARVFDIDTPIDSTEGRRRFRDLASSLLPATDAGTHNQAVMELGALICTPRKPGCTNCPVASWCLALAQDRVASLPVKQGRTRVRDRWFHYIWVQKGDFAYLQERPAGDIWQGLWEPPLIEGRRKLGTRAVTSALQELTGEGSWRLIGPQHKVRHILSHQHLHTRFWTAELPEGVHVPASWVAIPKRALDRYPMPRLVERSTYLLARMPTKNGTSGPEA
ncbi:MAG: A/G-specific adenine glycosylase [Flavobacteriales bacterium]|nr:A/G-specific adenine glycosylase [Flavobacteriales bacterium]